MKPTTTNNPQNPAVDNKDKAPAFRSAEEIAANTAAIAAKTAPTQGTQMLGTVDNYTQGISAFDIRNNNVQAYQASQQSAGKQILNRTLRFIPNVLMGAAEQVGYLADGENYLGAIGAVETDFNNWFSEAMKKGAEGLEEALPVMRADNETFSPSDSAWWVNNVFDVAESMAEFYITGAGTGAMLGKGASTLSNASRVKRIAGAISEGKKGAEYAKAVAAGTKLNNIANTAASYTNSALMAYTGGVMQGVDTFKNTKELALTKVNPTTGQKYTEEEANKIAGEAAATTVQMTTLFTSGLNVTSLAPVFRPFRNNVKFAELERGTVKQTIAKGLKEGAKVTDDDILGYLKNLKKNPVRMEKAASAWKAAFKPEGIAFEMGQEAVEEGAEFVAEQIGAGQGKEALGERGDIDWFSEDMILSMALGALGGAMGKGMMKGLEASPFGESQEDNDARNFSRTIATRIKILEDNKSALKAHKEAVKKGDPLAVQITKQKLFDQNKFHAIQQGTEDYLKAHYEEIATMSEEQAKDLGYETDPKSVEHYQKLAKEAIDDLDSAKMVYDSVMQDTNIPEDLKAEAINDMFALDSLERTSTKLEASIAKAYAGATSVKGYSLENKQAENKVTAMELLLRKLKSDPKSETNEQRINALLIRIAKAKDDQKEIKERAKEAGETVSSFALGADQGAIQAEIQLAYNNLLRDEQNNKVLNVHSPAAQDRKRKEKQDAEDYKKLKEEINPKFKELQASLLSGTNQVEAKGEFDQDGSIAVSPLNEDGSRRMEEVPMTVAQRQDKLKQLEELYNKLNAEDKTAMKPTMEKMRKLVADEKQATIDRNKAKAKSIADALWKESIEDKISNDYDSMTRAKGIADPSYNAFTPREILINPTDVIPAIYNGERGYITMEHGSKQERRQGLIQPIRFHGESGTVTIGDIDTTFEEMRVSIVKDSYYPVEFDAASYIFTIGKEQYTLDKNNIDDSMEFDETGLLQAITAISLTGKQVRFTNKVLINDIAQHVMLYDALFQNFLSDLDNRVVEQDGRSYIVESFDPSNPEKTIITNANGTQLLKNMDKLRRNDGELTKKGQIVERLLKKFEDTVLKDLKKRYEPTIDNTEDVEPTPAGTEGEVSSNESPTTSTGTPVAIPGTESPAGSQVANNPVTLANSQVRLTRLAIDFNRGKKITEFSAEDQVILNNPTLIERMPDGKVRVRQTPTTETAETISELGEVEAAASENLEDDSEVRSPTELGDNVQAELDESMTASEEERYAGFLAAMGNSEEPEGESVVETNEPPAGFNGIEPDDMPKGTFKTYAELKKELAEKRSGSPEVKVAVVEETKPTPKPVATPTTTAVDWSRAVKAYYKDEAIIEGNQADAELEITPNGEFRALPDMEARVNPDLFGDGVKQTDLSRFHGTAKRVGNEWKVVKVIDAPAAQLVESAGSGNAYLERMESQRKEEDDRRKIQEEERARAEAKKTPNKTKQEEAIDKEITFLENKIKKGEYKIPDSSEIVRLSSTGEFLDSGSYYDGKWIGINNETDREIIKNREYPKGLKQYKEAKRALDILKSPLTQKVRELIRLINNGSEFKKRIQSHGWDKVKLTSSIDTNPELWLKDDSLNLSVVEQIIDEELNKIKNPKTPVDIEFKTEETAKEAAKPAGVVLNGSILTANTHKVVGGKLVPYEPGTELYPELMSNPKYNEGTQVTFELGTEAYGQGNWKKQNIYVVIDGKKVAPLEADNPARKEIYEALKDGRVVTAKIGEKRTTNLVQLTDETGKPIRKPISGLSEQFTKVGDTYEVRNEPVVLTSTQGVMPDEHNTSQAIPQLNRNGISVSIMRQVEDTNVQADGTVFALVMGPRGKYIPIRTSTANLGPNAQNKILELFTELGKNPKNKSITDDLHKLIFLHQDSDRAEVGHFIQVMETDKGDYFLRFKTAKDGVVAIDMNALASAIENNSTASVRPQVLVADKKGKTILANRKDEKNNVIHVNDYDVVKELRDFLKTKKYNVTQSNLTHKGNYTSPVTGTTYKNYLEYVSSTTEETGESASILTTDVVNNHGSMHYNMGMKLTSINITKQPVRVQVAPIEEKTTDTKREFETTTGGVLSFEDADKTTEGTTEILTIETDGDEVSGDFIDDDEAFSSKKNSSGVVMNEAAAREWLAARNIPVEFYEQVRRVGDKVAHGSYRNGLVRLWKSGDAGTEYHEAFHAIFRGFNTDKQREQLLQEAKERYGDMTDLEAEERLADEFATYVMSNQKPRNLKDKIWKFFKDLYNYLKTFVSNERSIDQLFSNIESGFINHQNPQRHSGGEVFSLMPGFTTNSQEEVLDTINSLVVDHLDSHPNANPRDTYEAVRKGFLVAAFRKVDKTDESPITIKEAEALYEFFGKDRKSIPAKSGFGYNAQKSAKMFKIIESWEETRSGDEFNNLLKPGWKGLAQKRLKAFGLKVYSHDSEQLEEQIGEDKIYGMESFEESRKDTISGEVKKFFSRIKSDKTNVIGQNSFIPFDEIFQDTATAVVFSMDWEQMMNQIAFAAKSKPQLKKVHEALATKDAKFKADFFKNMSMIHISFTSAEEKVTWIPETVKGEVKWKPEITIRYFDSNTARAERRIMTDWRKRMKPANNKGLFKKVDGKFILNETKGKDGLNRAEKLRYYHKLMQAVKNGDQFFEGEQLTPLGKENVETLVAMLKILGSDMKVETVADYLRNGKIVGTEILDGAELFRHLTHDKGGNISLSAMFKNIDEGLDPYDTDGSILKRFVEIQERVETDYMGSFINGAGKSTHPFNMPTFLSDYFHKYKTDPSFLEMFTSDPYFVPDQKAGVNGEYTSLFLERMMNSQEFRDVLHLADIDVYKTKDEKGDSNNTFDEMGRVKSVLHRVNAFLNNANNNEMQIALPTLSDRGRMMMLTIPRISNNAKRHKYAKSATDILTTYVMQDIARAKKAAAEVDAARASGDYSQMIANYHYTPVKGSKLAKSALEGTTGYTGRAMQFTQLEFLNNSEAARMLKDALMTGGDEQFILDSNEYADLIAQVKADIQRYIEEETIRFKASLDKLGINKEEKGRTLNTIDPKGLAAYNGNVMELARDFVTSGMIAKNEIIKMTGVDLAYYKNYENFSKRFGGLATPGYRSYQANWNSGGNDSYYGDKRTYTTAYLNDVKSGNDFVVSLVDAGYLDKKIAETYYDFLKKTGKSNKTDGMGFTTLDKHRSKMMGMGTWENRPSTSNRPSHEEAFANYYNAPVGQRRFIDNSGNYPLLTPLKTYHDGLYKKNGRIVRIMVKHSTFPLLEEFTKNSRGFNELRKRMEGEGTKYEGQVKLDSVNMDSAIKTGLYGNIEMFNPDGTLADLTQMTPVELLTSNERIPQVLPEHTSKQPLWGSQVRKLLITNIKKDGIYTLSDGTSITGEQLLTAYHGVIGEFIERSTAQLYKELGYDEYQANPTRENKIKFMKKLRTILANSVDDRDLPENYQKVLKLMEDSGKIDFEVPLAYPSYQRKFEQIIFSLFKNNVMNQKMNGASMVQVAELAGHDIDKDLKFVRAESVSNFTNGAKTKVTELTEEELVRYKKTAVKHAEVAIPFKMAQKLGLDDPKYYNSLGEIDVDKIPENLRTIIGYRIPTQGKNSTLPMIIKRIMPMSMGKSIMVPGEITTQMGSDFDIDKLYLMMPNADTKYKRKDGSIHSEEHFYRKRLEKFENGKYVFTNPELRQIIEDDNIIDTFMQVEKSDMELLLAELKQIRKEHKELVKDMEKTVIKSPYTITWSRGEIESQLANQTREGLENLIMDISTAILLNPAHTNEMLATVDSTTIPDLATKMKEAYPEMNRPLDPNGAMTETELEMRNKVGGTGIGIYATKLTGHAIGQYSNLRLTTPITVSGKEYNNLSETKVNGHDVAYGLSERLGSSVDNANEPNMTFINDSPLTSGIIGLFNRLGISSEKYNPNQVVSFYLNQPIIRELTERYEIEEANPSELYELIDKLGKDRFKGFDLSDSLGSEIREIDIDYMERSLGKSLKDAGVDQSTILSNFYHYHKLGRMLGKVDKVYNADRISDMSSLSAIEEFMDVVDTIENRNELIEGIENVLENDAYPTTKHFLKAIKSAADFSNQFFPFNGLGMTQTKSELREALNKETLTKDMIDAINKNAFLWMFYKDDSPFRSVFTLQRTEELFYSPNNISNTLVEMKNNEVLKTNKFLQRLSINEDNIKDGDTIPILNYDYSYSMSAFEHSQMSDDFLVLARHSDPTVRKFAKDLVDYQILTKGFSPGINSFADIIPIELWTEKEFYDGGETMAEYFRRTYNRFESGSEFSGFADIFIQNNTHIKGLVPNIKSALVPGKMYPAKKPYYHREFANSPTFGFSKYLMYRDRKTKEVKLYKIDKYNPDGASYIEIPVLGIAHKTIDMSPNGIYRKEAHKSDNAFVNNIQGNSYGWSRYAKDSYEVSSAGDSRFSALNAKLKDGRTIEEAYQLDVKGYRSKGNDWKLGKNKPPLKAMSREESWKQYKALWQTWANENPTLIEELAIKAKGKTLTDKFASTDVSQARALAEILNERKPTEVSDKLVDKTINDCK